MAKLVNEIFEKIKGAENIDKILTSRKRFNANEFKSVVTALANDSSYKVDNFKTEEEFSIGEAIRSDLKKTIERAKFPQKNEASVLDNVDICVDGLAKAIPYIVLEHLKTGRTFDLPDQEKLNASIYLQDRPATTRDIPMRNPKTGEDMGTATIINKDHFILKAKSPVPKNLQRRVYKDLNGKPLK